MPKAVKEEVPVAAEGPGFWSRQVEWGGMTFAFEAGEQAMDPAPLFAALPSGRCQCPHWGYVLEGSITFRYEDHEERINAGELYYAAPGHVPLVNEPGKLIELSPTAQFRETMDALEAALAEEQSRA